jgi:hypothetical protein
MGHQIVIQISEGGAGTAFLSTLDSFDEKVLVLPIAECGMDPRTGPSRGTYEELAPL